MATRDPSGGRASLRAALGAAAVAFGAVACGNDYSAFRVYAGAAGLESGPAPGGAAAQGGVGGRAATGGSANTGGAGGTGGTGGTATTGGRGGTGGSAPSCATRYGAAPEFLLCAETATSCRFLRNSSPALTCDTVCSTYGGTCIDADNGDPGSCTISGAADCSTSLTSSICVCSRP
jgi:hypothetical protein